MISDLERAFRLAPDNAQIMNNLGYSLLSDSKRLDEGFALLQTAYQINPDDTAVNDSIGWAYYLKGDAESALPYLRYSFENDPEPEVAAHLGEVLWALGERDQAVDVWTQAAHLRETRKYGGKRSNVTASHCPNLPANPGNNAGPSFQTA